MAAKIASVLSCGLSFLFVAACGGSQPQPAAPPTDEDDEVEAPDESWETGPAPAPEAAEDAEAAPSDAPDEARKEPEFKEGMTVNDAIAAVPSHYDYIGIDQEVLAKPLMNIETYKECKVTQATHFAVKIAVWDGRVVGADVDAKGNKALASCIDGVVRKIEYKERVESINTVEFSF